MSSEEGMEPLSLSEESELNELQATQRSSRMLRGVAAVLCAVAMVSVFFLGRWSSTQEKVHHLEPVGEKISAVNGVIEMASSDCKDWCSADSNGGGWCWKCNSYGGSCAGCSECSEENCAPADCKSYCSKKFAKSSTETVCAMKQCAGCDECPTAAVIKDASNYICEDNKNYLDQAEEWAKGDNDGTAYSRAECASLCDGQSGCRAYILSSGGKCWLKSNVGIVNDDSGSLACKVTNYDPDGFVCEHGVNYVGHSQETHYGSTKSMADCAAKCKAQDWCHVYVYNQGAQNCYIKDKVGKTDHGHGGTESCRDSTVTYSW